MASSSASRAAWLADPAGLRFMRRDLLPAVAIVASVFLVVGISLDRGDATLYLLIVALDAGQVALALGLARIGRRIPGAQQIRIVLATTPATFILVGMAGWSGPHGAYYPSVAAVIAGIVAMVVGLSQPTKVLTVWAALSCAALLGGAYLVAGGSPSILLPPISLVGQAWLAWLIRDGIQRYHAERRAVVHEMASLTPLASAGATAESIAGRLQAGGPSQVVLVLQFTALGETVLIAGSGEPAAMGLRVGDVLPSPRNELLRAKALEGPWLTRWSVRPEDGPYGERIAAAGITAAAYVPLAFEGRLIGLIVMADSRPAEEGLAELAERLPALIEVGELAGALLGPGFIGLDASSVAALRLDGILAAGAFTPIFQPVVELETGEVVGFEALTRFEGATPDEVFEQAARLGRLQELEIVTLTKALAAAEQLPANRWLSVNVSQVLLADTSTLRGLVRGSIRPIVLELSEHELVSDYRALTTSLKRMAPWVSLAIDDAGAGFSSLRHILELSPSWVKLDIGLVRGVDADPARQALVAGLVHFARQAAIALIAEGIETAAEHVMLKSLGVKLGQGFFLARPAPIDDPMVQALVRSEYQAGRRPR